mmetsp:Transcript_37070/g.71118  ORF Transcript_37070/g.71118 Transcript_37070/m.71118 type:complete len:249 (-) Transcript_37070:18-764(-)
MSCHASGTDLARGLEARGVAPVRIPQPGAACALLVQSKGVAEGHQSTLPDVRGPGRVAAHNHLDGFVGQSVCHVAGLQRLQARVVPSRKVAREYQRKHVAVHHQRLAQYTAKIVYGNKCCSHGGYQLQPGGLLEVFICQIHLCGTKVRLLWSVQLPCGFPFGAVRVARGASRAFHTVQSAVGWQPAFHSAHPAPGSLAVVTRLKLLSRALVYPQRILVHFLREGSANANQIQRGGILGTYACCLHGMR